MGNEKVIIVGTTMFSGELQYILMHSGIEVIGFSVDEAYIKSHNFCNLPVYPFEKIDRYVDMAKTKILLAIGYSEMNNHRMEKYLYCKEKGYKIYSFCSNKAIILTENIGEGNIIMPGSYVGPYSKLGVCNVIRAGAVLSHHDIVGNYNWIADGCIIGGGITIGNNCFIGLGSTIRNEITVSDYSFIGAHSYLGHETKLHSVHYGVPAKLIENQDSIEKIKKV